MITKNSYRQIQRHIVWMLNHTRKEFSIDLAHVKVFISPKSGIGALLQGNPAICIRYNQMQHAINVWRKNAQDYANEHQSECIPHHLIEKGKCIILAQHVLQSTCIDQCGIIWHEYGHAYNETRQIKNTEANAYLFEVDMITAAWRQGVLQMYDVMAKDVHNYLGSRQNYFDNGTNELADKLAYLRALLDIEVEPFQRERFNRYFWCAYSRQVSLHNQENTIAWHK
ncbi:MAG: hypothetical protein IT497_09960 [Ottowia sp.]|nr:hypothetical protein [Ottowia sp.]